MKNFITSLLAQMPEGTGLPDEHMIPMTTDAGEVTAVIPENDPETVLFRAAVGSLAGVSDSDGFLRQALAGNRFWAETGGATLSLGEGETLYLTARYEDALFASETAVGTVLSAFAQVLSSWRDRLAIEKGGAK